MPYSSTKIYDFVTQYPVVTFAKGKTIIAAGETNPPFYFVEEGTVKMQKTTLNGQIIILHLFLPKSFFSLITVALPATQEYDYISLTPTVVRKIPQLDMIAYMQHNHDVSYDIMIRLLKGMQGLLRRIESANTGHAYNQVASLLVYFSEHFSDKKVTKRTRKSLISLRITHQEMSDWLGLSRENVSLQMKELEKNGLISFNSSLIEIPNLDNLREIALLY